MVGGSRTFGQWLLPLAAAFAAALGGCVSETAHSGRTALWTSVKKKGSDDEKLRLKHPVKTNVAFARMAESRGKHEDARRFYQTALSHNAKSVDALVGIARLDQYAGRMDDAERGFQKAQSLAPGDPQVLNAAGMFYAGQKRWNEALPRLQAAVAASPNSRDYRYNLGLVLANAGNPNAAVPLMATKIGEARAHYEAAYILNQQRRQAEAVHHLQLALSKDPGLASASRMLAQLQDPGRRRTGNGRPVDARQGQLGSRGPIRSVGHFATNRTPSYDRRSAADGQGDRFRRPVTIGHPTPIVAP